MPIPFDDAIAGTLSTNASDAAIDLRGQSSSRSSAAENALADFAGGYAELFNTARMAESEDRLKLAGVLDDLSRDVDEARQLARDENDRLARLEAWEEREAERAADPNRLKSWMDGLMDPEPSEPPIAPPTISAAFSAQQRSRLAGGGQSGGTSSANPESLRGFAKTSGGQNLALSSHLLSVRSAWSSFVGSCWWVPVGAASFVDGFDQLLSENTADVTWIESIAQAFEEAGTGEVSSFQLSLAVAVGQPQYLRDLLRSNDLTSEQIAAAAEYLSKYPELASWVGPIVANDVRGLTSDSSEEDITRVAALLNGFSANGPASEAILDSLGADNLIRIIGMGAAVAWDQTGRGKGDAADRLVQGLRDVFRRGEPEMSDDDSRQFARDLVTYLDDPAIDVEFPGNHPYALSYLLRGSSLSTPFLGELGNSLEDFEKSHSHIDHLWETRTAGAIGGSKLFDEGWEGAYDPMTSYMSALGMNGEAALQFFTGTGAEDPTDYLSDDEIFARREYWIERRPWGHDDFNGLLSALDAATTSPESRNDPEATKLVSLSFEMLANRTHGENADHEKVKFGSDDKNASPGTLGGDASTHLAHIFGTYMKSVDYYVNDVSNSSPGAGHEAPFWREDLGDQIGMPVFDRDDLSVLARAGLSNEEGFVAFRKAVTNYQDVHFDNVVTDYYDSEDFQRVLGVAANNDARLEAFFMHSLGDAKIADGLEKDDQIQAWIDLGSDVAGEIPFDKIPGAGEVIGFLADQALDAGADALTESLAHHEEDAVADANELADEALASRRNSIIGGLYRNGVITYADVDLIAERWGFGDQAEVWFVDGFPDSETIRSDQRLQNLVAALGNGRFDLGLYRLNYENEFEDLFE